MKAHPFTILTEAREHRTPCDVHGGWCREHEAQAPCSFGPVDVSTAKRMRETMRPKVNPVMEAAAALVFGPEAGEVVTLPGGLEAIGAEVMRAGEWCELCGDPHLVGEIVYGIPCGGGWITVHAACLGECR